MNTFEDLEKFIRSYCNIVEEGLKERWKKLPIELYDSSTYEVIGGLLARQATLSIYLALSPTIWNGHIAPLILRCMTDAHITLARILNEPRERAKKYILYGLGQEKLHLEHLKKDSIEENKELIDFKEKWLNSQRLTHLTEVNVGNWGESNTRIIAQESGCENLYNFAYVPFSGATHNMWQHVSRYNLKYCNNPLHKYHQVPEIPYPSEDPDFLVQSAKYLSSTFFIVDEKFNLRIETTMPVEFLKEEFKKFADKEENQE